MADLPKLTELSADSIRISTQRRMVRVDDASEETEQCYLTIEGSPEGFQWLSQHFSSLAKSAERNEGPAGNIVAARDFKNDPVKLENWDSLDFHCENL